MSTTAVVIKVPSYLADTWYEHGGQREAPEIVLQSGQPYGGPRRFTNRSVPRSYSP